MAMAKDFHSTRTAARLAGVSFRTLNRWLNLGRMKPSKSIAVGEGRYVWLWSDRDIEKIRKIKATLRSGRGT